MRAVLLCCYGSLVFSWAASARSIQHKTFQHTWTENGGGTRCLRVEVLDENLVHFEIFERRGHEIDHDKKCLRENDMIWITPMVDGRNEAGAYFDGSRPNDYRVHYNGGYSGPEDASFRKHADGIETSQVRVKVSDESRCVSVFDKVRNVELTDKLCAEELNKDNKFLRVSKKNMFNFYGVGNLFTRDRNPNGDWKGIKWDVSKNADRPGNLRGPTFHNGDPSTSQFPVVYALGPGLQNYLLFFDNGGRMSMDFTEQERFSYETYGDELRFFVMTGPHVRQLRSDFLRLTGRPPLPPKGHFGHTTSKFGFKSWGEVEEEVSKLRSGGFPLDGVALDLQWFGGKFGDPETFRMGVLQFGNEFPDPQGKVREFYDKYGITFMPIEESYIDDRLDEHRALVDGGFRNSTPGFRGITGDDGCFLAREHLDFNGQDGGWKPARVDVNFKRTLSGGNTVWWGRGGMLDHTNPHGRYFWHQLKRRWLTKMGITQHWGDLMEPEMFYEYAYYQGFPELYREWQVWENGDRVTRKNIVQKHGDIHNFYGLLWAKGVEEGYANAENASFAKPMLREFYGHDYEDGPRHTTMTRASTVGGQRYGGLWTGDTRGNFENFVGHLQTQLHAPFFGFDYYSGDVGGFFHIKDGKDPGDHFDRVLYKQWMAVASLAEIPVRPHGWALEEGISYGAHVRGHPDSNRANLWRRYELIPYLYSLAHRAHRFGEAIFPPLVFHFQEDLTVRENGTERMMGPSLLFRVVADWRGYNQKEADSAPVYLPKGKWVDYESLEWFDSNGGITRPIAFFRKERVPASAPADTYYFLNPLFAREGAIIPKAYVDEKTMNALGKRWGEAPREELAVRVFSSPNASDFTLYEDDGVSRGYLRGKVRETVIHQRHLGNRAEVTINAAGGQSYVGAPGARKNVVELVVRNQRVTPDGVRVNSQAQRRCSADEKNDFDKAQHVCWYQASDQLVRVRTSDREVSETKTFQFVFE